MPTTIYTAYTAPCNPPSSPVKLTRPLLWKALQRKVRRGQDFVPAIESCEVLEDGHDEQGNERVVREVAFGLGMIPGATQKKVREVCLCFEPCKVDFHLPNGATITNIISDGTSLDPTDLNMTYVFEWRHPEVEKGSDKEKELLEQHRNGAKMAVDKSLESIRRMVEDGSLKA